MNVFLVLVRCRHISQVLLPVKNTGLLVDLHTVYCILLRSQDGDHWGWKVSNAPLSTLVNFWPLWVYHPSTTTLHFDILSCQCEHTNTQNSVNMEIFQLRQSSLGAGPQSTELIRTSEALSLLSKEKSAPESILLRMVRAHFRKPSSTFSPVKALVSRNISSLWTNIGNNRIEKTGSIRIL